MKGKLDDLIFTCYAQKHPFPTASVRGCCFSNIQRISLTDYFVMLEIGHDLKPKVVIMERGVGKGHLRNSMAVLLTSA